jgi:hypothetical protein
MPRGINAIKDAWLLGRARFEDSMDALRKEIEREQLPVKTGILLDNTPPEVLRELRKIDPKSFDQTLREVSHAKTKLP